MEKIKHYIKKIFEIISLPEMKILPAQVAFFSVLSIAPILALLVATAGFFSIDLRGVVTFMGEFLPANVSELLTPFITGRGFDFNIGFSMFLGLFVASNGANSIIVASNALYKTEPGSFLERRVKAVVLTLLLVILFLFNLIVLAFGNHILKWVLSFKVFASVSGNIYKMFIALKWPTAFFVIFIIVKVLYTMAPDFELKSKYVTKGALFASISFIVVTAIYTYYVANFAHYSLFYGGLSNLVILMIWIYILAFILMIGMAINVTSYNIPENSKHK